MSILALLNTLLLRIYLGAIAQPGGDLLVQVLNAPPDTSRINAALLTIATWLAGLVGGVLTLGAVIIGLQLAASGGHAHAVASARGAIISGLAGVLLIVFAISGGGSWLAETFGLSGG